MNVVRGIGRAALALALLAVATSGVSLLSAASDAWGMPPVRDAAGAPVRTDLSFTAGTLSQQITDFTGGSVAVTLYTSKGKPLAGDGQCGGSPGTIQFAFTSSAGGSTTKAGCTDSTGTASIAVPDAFSKAPLGTKYTVRAAFVPCAACTWAPSTTSQSATLTVSPTPVVATANIDYSKSNPTTAVIHGDLASADGSDSYEKVPAGTWTIAVTSSDNSAGITVTRKASSPGVDPAWSVTGLKPGTVYSASMTFLFPASDAGRHSVTSSRPATFATAGTAPVTTPTPTPTPDPVESTAPDPVGSTAPASTPQPSASATKDADAASAEKSGGISITPILWFLVGTLVLVIILALVALAVYRNKRD